MSEFNLYELQGFDPHQGGFVDVPEQIHDNMPEAWQAAAQQHSEMLKSGISDETARSSIYIVDFYGNRRSYSLIESEQVQAD